MGRVKEMAMEEQQRAMLDADNRNEEWKSGVVEIQFRRTYIFGRAEIYQQMKEGEDTQDVMERIALKMFQDDWDHLSANTDDFELEIKKD